MLINERFLVLKFFYPIQYILLHIFLFIHFFIQFTVVIMFLKGSEVIRLTLERKKNHWAGIFKKGHSCILFFKKYILNWFVWSTFL